MIITDRGIELIKKFEGFSAKPYLCAAGVPTIGYGSTYYENGVSVSLKDSEITEEWAEELLLSTLDVYEKAINSMVISHISQNQYDALVSFVYNVGVTNFKKSSILKIVNVDPNDPKIATEFGRWVRANGKIIKGLVKRRQLEAELYFAHNIADPLNINSIDEFA